MTTNPETPPGHSDTTTSSDGRPAKDANAAEIEADILRTREELGRTIEDLAGKLDVKSQARDTVAAVRRRATKQTRLVQDRCRPYAVATTDAVTDDQGSPKPIVTAAGAAVATMAATVVAMVIWSRSR